MTGQTMPMGRLPRLLLASSLLALATAGCAPGEVALEGKIFEATGITSALQGSKANTAQVAARAPLVVPPTLDRLPQPGSGSDVAAADPSFPVNPESRQTDGSAAKQREHDDFCRKNYDRLRSLGSHSEADALTGPLGSCAPSALRSLTGTTPAQSFNRTDAASPSGASVSADAPVTDTWATNIKGGKR